MVEVVPEQFVGCLGISHTILEATFAVELETPNPGPGFPATTDLARRLAAYQFSLASANSFVIGWLHVGSRLMSARERRAFGAMSPAACIQSAYPSGYLRIDEGLELAPGDQAEMELPSKTTFDQTIAKGPLRQISNPGLSQVIEVVSPDLSTDS